MNNYTILKNNEHIATHISTETDMRFALAEWLFEASHNLESGEYVNTDKGYSIVVNDQQFEIQPIAPLKPESQVAVTLNGEDES